MEPWQNWLVALGIGGAAAAYYSRSSSTAKRKPSEASKGNAKPVKGEQRSSSPAAVSKADASGNDASTPKQAKKSNKKKNKTGQQPAAATTNSAPSNPAEDDDEPDAPSNDQEWARQLSAARQGVTLSVPDKNQRQRSPRRPQAEAATDEASEQPKSDKKSSASVQNAPADNVTASAGDVSDMLEPTPAGPSVVRVTGEEQAKKPKAPQAPAPVQETKKQRQNRKKVEEKKLAREQEEKERKVAEEKQRRTAREARGEPAKNGLGAASVPASSAWSQSNKANGAPVVADSNGVKNAPLLDTLEHDAVSTSSSNEPAAHHMTPSTSPSTHEQELPSEETQMQMLSQMNGDAGWNEVTKPKKGKKKNTNATTSPERQQKENLPKAAAAKPKNQYSGISTTDLISQGVKTPGQPSKKAASTNGFAALEAATGFTPGSKGHPEDSDWAVDG
ncbi:MAG: hypothetical protein M1828_001502 [Chrysothrix sp. TS-e1954]|nr:MAG: hypothetical protein M1828_001502 [Chrysothrix sp. TS-e1954]